MRQTTRRQFLARIGAAGGAAVLAGGGFSLAPARGAAAAGPQPADGAGGSGRKKPNVIFIPVDDLRVQLGCYGCKQMLSPNIDALAAAGVRFDRAYCQQAVCAPSRASLLTSCRPDTTRIYDLEHPLRQMMPDVLSLPQHFKNHGYTTISIGKVYHHRNDDLVGWSKEPYREKGQWKGRGYLDPESIRQMEAADARVDQALAQAPATVPVKAKTKAKAQPRKGLGPAFEAPDVPDSAYPDGVDTDLAIQELRALAAASAEKPFFLAVGFYRPHLPFNAPKRYWDLYKPEAIRLPTNDTPPANAPPMALPDFGELRAYTNIPAKGKCPDELARKLIHGYYAAVSYTDACIGRLLDELDRLKIRDNTVIVLWGDHGWKLGEYGSWCKHTNFEYDTHAPLLFAGPGVPRGQSTKALAEFVDIYPTLCELAGLPMPEHCEGVSLVPVMRQPDRPWKTAAFSQYPRGAIMGYAMRTDRYRYVRWMDRKSEKVVARELYDHQADDGENRNLADEAAMAETIAKLDAQALAGWKAARPKA